MSVKEYRSKDWACEEVGAILALVFTERVERGAVPASTEDEVGRAWMRYVAGHRAVLYGSEEEGDST